MPSDVLPGYTYDRSINRYRSNDTGKFTSRSNVVDLLEQQISGAEDRMDALAESTIDGTLAPATYAEVMSTELRRLHLQQAALANGGWDRLDQSDYGRVGASLKKLYPKIRGTAQDISDRDVSILQVQNRNVAYAGSARSLFYKMERDNATITSVNKTLVERRYLDPAAEHCEDCLRYARQGIVYKGTLPVPGEECECRHNCRCTLEVWEIDVNQVSKNLVTGFRTRA